MNQAISAYHSVTASSEFRELERLRAKARHDEAQALYHAEIKGEAKGRAEGEAKGRAEGEAKGRAEGEAKGRAEGEAKGRAEGILSIAGNMLKRNKPIDEIIEDTGLTRAEVENLRGR
ncbi:MAG: hypothetical protein FWF87_08210 [Synergistaceae bacterium]|nr:hypothetical protein [Synergistaceae bacterium]